MITCIVGNAALLWLFSPCCELAMILAQPIIQHEAVFTIFISVLIGFRYIRASESLIHRITWCTHDDVIKWKHFPRNWPFVREIHRSPVNFPHKGQLRGALMFSLIYA